MKRHRLPTTHLITALALLGAGIIAGSGPGMIVHADPDPCDSVQEDPPIDDPEPMIGGTVIDADTSTAVSGATVRLYRCDGGASTLVATDSTDLSGDYLFESLTTKKYYYVSVIMSGPLSGYSTASGTSNPSALLDVGPSHTAVDFDFEQ